MSLWEICGILCGIIAVQNITHFIERRELYNRIMSRDLREFEKFNGKSEPVEPVISAHRRAINDWKGEGDSR